MLRQWWTELSGKDDNDEMDLDDYVIDENGRIDDDEYSCRSRAR